MAPTVAVALFRQYETNQCVGIRAFAVDSTASLAEFEKTIAAVTGEEVLYLKYRGKQPNIFSRNASLSGFAPASSETVRFSAILAPKVRASHESFPIKVSLPTGNSIMFRVKPQTFLRAMTPKIEAKTGVHRYDQKFLWDGDFLPCNMTFADHRLDSESEIDMMPTQVGGGSGGASFADVSNTNKLKSIGFSDEAPFWRTSAPGLNVEGTCMNPACQAHGKVVIARKGFVSWSLTAERANCPMCNDWIAPRTCAFTSCAWIYDGCKTGPGGTLEDVAGEWTEASSDKYHRFEEEDNQAQWNMLVLTARAAFSTKPSVPQPCSVCFEIPAVDHAHVANCGHCFHKSCLDAWKLVRPTMGCPMCRSLV